MQGHHLKNNNSCGSNSQRSNSGGVAGGFYQSTGSNYPQKTLITEHHQATRFINYKAASVSTYRFDNSLDNNNNITSKQKTCQQMLQLLSSPSAKSSLTPRKDNNNNNNIQNQQQKQLLQLSKQQLNAKILQAHRLSIDTQQSMSQQAAVHIPAASKTTTNSSLQVNGGVGMRVQQLKRPQSNFAMLKLVGSPSCKQKMSPRTLQPSSMAATVPTAPTASILDNSIAGVGVMAPNNQVVYPSVCDIPDDGVSLSPPQESESYSSGQELDKTHSAERILSCSEEDVKQPADPANQKPSKEQYMNHWKSKSETHMLLKQSTQSKASSTAIPIIDIEINAVKQRNRIITTIEATDDGEETQANFNMSIPSVDISRISKEQHKFKRQQQNTSPSQQSQQRQQHNLDQFIRKQQEYENRKQEKIRKALHEKEIKQKQEFEQNATFRPFLESQQQKKRAKQSPQQAASTTAMIKKKTLGSRSPPLKKGRTIEQFVNDQQSYMRQSKAKIENERKCKELAERESITANPKLNPKSERICQKIQAQYYAQVVREYSPKTAGVGVSLESELKPIHENPRTNSDSSYRRGEQSQQSSSSQFMKKQRVAGGGTQQKQQLLSSAAHKLIEQKRAIAKAKPQELTFVPKINKKSQRLVNMAQIRYSKQIGLVHQSQNQPEQTHHAHDSNPTSTISSNFYGANIEPKNENNKLSQQFDQTIDNDNKLLRRGSHQLSRNHYNNHGSPSLYRNEAEPEVAMNCYERDYLRAHHTQEDILYQQVVLSNEEGRRESRCDNPFPDTMIMNNTSSVRSQKSAATNITFEKTKLKQTTQQKLFQSNTGVVSRQGGVIKQQQQQKQAAYQAERHNQQSPRQAAQSSKQQSVISARQLQSQQEEKKRNLEEITRKKNESLILKNFKKEFDAVMVELYLGPTLTKDTSSETTTAARPSAIKGVVGQHHRRVGTDLTSHTAVSGTTTQYYTANSQDFTSSYSQAEESIRVDLRAVLQKLGYIQTSSTQKSQSPKRKVIAAAGTADSASAQHQQFICTLDDRDQKNAFKANLFTTLAAVQSINLKDHYSLYGTFGVLQSHILEQVVQEIDRSHKSYQWHQTANQLLNGGNSGRSKLNKNSSNGSTGFIQDLTSKLTESVIQLAMQPFPFQLTNQQKIKMHLTFMSFFLNRKDSISRNYRQILDDQQNEKYKFKPEILNKNRAVSPKNQQRAPISDPSGYYSELKKEMKERTSKLSSLRAEKERDILRECTFKPTVNPKSTQMAYKQVVERYVVKKIEETYATVDDTSDKLLTEDDNDNIKSSDVVGVEAQNQSQQNCQHKRSPSTKRISDRINIMVHQFAQQKREGGTKHKDITTEQREYEKSRKEMTFHPDIQKSQLSMKLSIGRPTGGRSGASSPRAGILNQKSIRFSQSPASSSNRSNKKYVASPKSSRRSSNNNSIGNKSSDKNTGSPPNGATFSDRAAIQCAPVAQTYPKQLLLQSSDKMIFQEQAKTDTGKQIPLEEAVLDKNTNEDHKKDSQTITISNVEEQEQSSSLHCVKLSKDVSEQQKSTAAMASAQHFQYTPGRDVFEFQQSSDEEEESTILPLQFEEANNISKTNESSSCFVDQIGKVVTIQPTQPPQSQWSQQKVPALPSQLASPSQQLQIPGLDSIQSVMMQQYLIPGQAADLDTDEYSSSLRSTSQQQRRSSCDVNGAGIDSDQQTANFGDINNSNNNHNEQNSRQQSSTSKGGGQKVTSPSLVDINGFSSSSLLVDGNYNSSICKVEGEDGQDDSSAGVVVRFNDAPAIYVEPSSVIRLDLDTNPIEMPSMDTYRHNNSVQEKSFTSAATPQTVALQQFLQPITEEEQTSTFLDLDTPQSQQQQQESSNQTKTPKQLSGDNAPVIPIVKDDTLENHHREEQDDSTINVEVELLSKKVRPDGQTSNPFVAMRPSMRPLSHDLSGRSGNSNSKSAQIAAVVADRSTELPGALLLPTGNTLDYSPSSLIDQQVQNFNAFTDRSYQQQDVEEQKDSIVYPPVKVGTKTTTRQDGLPRGSLEPQFGQQQANVDVLYTSEVACDDESSWSFSKKAESKGANNQKNKKLNQQLIESPEVVQQLAGMMVGQQDIIAAAEYEDDELLIKSDDEENNTDDLQYLRQTSPQMLAISPATNREPPSQESNSMLVTSDIRQSSISCSSNAEAVISSIHPSCNSGTTPGDAWTGVSTVSGGAGVAHHQQVRSVDNFTDKVGYVVQKQEGQQQRANIADCEVRYPTNYYDLFSPTEQPCTAADRKADLQQ